MARPTSLTAALAAMVPKVMIWDDIVAAVFLRDVIDDLAAAAHAEIDVDIGHGDALGVEEALEEQVVLERIDVGDAQRVADEAARSGAATGTDGNFLRAGVMNEIPDDQEVAFIMHLLDHFDFGSKARFVIRQWIAQEDFALPGVRDWEGAAKNLRGPFFQNSCRACGLREL